MNVLSSIKRIFSYTKVKNQLYIIYITALLIPVLIIGAFLLFNSRRLLLEHYYNHVEADNTRVKSIMFDVTTNTYNISDDIFTDKNLQTLLATRYSSMKQAVNHCNRYNKINNYIQKNTFISSIELYTSNPTMYNCGNFKVVTEDIMEQNWYQQTVRHADIHWQSINVTDNWGHTTQELCLLRRIPVISTGEYAVLAIRISNAYLKNRIQNNDLFISVSVNQDPVFFGTMRDITGTYLPFPISYGNSQYVYSGRLTYNDRTGIGHISTLVPYISKDKIYISTLDFHSLIDISNILLISGAIIILGCVLPLIMIAVFTNQFSSRIVTLRAQMHKASRGDYHIIDSFNGNDELSEVFSDLKVMIQSIIDMNGKMYEAKIHEQVLKNQQQKMEYKMLASQINPHFLYNTLETIRMKALTQGNKEVADAIKLLGKSMHYVLENTGTSYTTLDRELDYIATYLAIQKLRFNDRINYTLNVAEGTNPKEYQILPLLLQPIVENAILHGLKDVEENGHICIDIKKDDESLCINISDNGSGMAEEELSSLTNNITEKDVTKTSGIGLYNINRRIRLFYGDAYGMDIKSKPEEGTLVSLTLPLYNTVEE